MKITIKKYQDLSSDKLYEILRLRSEVFVVEQNCAYQDLDNKDQKALHLIVEEKNKIIAYTRIFKKGDFISFEPGSKHSSHTINGCLVLVFMRGINKAI